MNKDQHLFSVTAKDCRWDYYKASGKGGQKRNKTESAVRCTHIASGAVGNCSETRSKQKNKEIAFKRMANSETFQNWIFIEAARVTGTLQRIEEKVDFEMNHNTRLEIKNDEGRWIKWVKQDETF